MSAAVARRWGASLAGAAVLVAAVTVAARVAGFGRQLVFTGTVGQTDLGTAYTTANYVPNIVFEVVAGGALASLVVPVLAGPLAAGDTARAGRVASALLTWVVAVLLPVAVLGALVARPVMAALLRSKGADPALLDVATRMLLVFLPQVVFYGLAVVTGGILQAQRRFLPAALAPVVSSVVVATAYVVFAAGFTGNRDDLASLDRRSELVLSAGTTLGVLALMLCTVLPVATAGLVLRPTLRFPDGVAAQVRRLAVAGVATLLAQQAATVAVLMLSNDRGSTGAVVTYQNAWMVYLLPYAVLAVPIATSAFPRLAEHAAGGDRTAYAAVTASSMRAVLLVCAAGAALLAGTAGPVGALFALITPGEVPAAEMTRALVAFAPGLVGYGIVAHLGRALLADGRGRAAATATVAGWAGVVIADVVLAAAVPRDWVVAALAAGHTVGMTVAGVLLVAALRASAGPAALAGSARAAVAGVAGMLAGGSAGWAAGWATGWAAGPPTGGSGGSAAGLVPILGGGALGGLAALLAWTAGVVLLGGADVRAVVGAVGRRGWRDG